MFLCTIKGGFPRYRESFIVTLVDKYCAISEVSTPTRNWFKEFMQYYNQKFLTVNCYN